VIIKRIGIVPVPVKLRITYEDETSEEYYFSAEVWQDENDNFVTEVLLTKTLKEIFLGDPYIPDTNTDNNLFVVH